jgi:hypothetical protein
MLVVAMAAAVAGVGRVGAEPLAREACDVLKAEHAQLEAAGLPETLKKGAAWGKVNLSREKLKEVERFIGLEEQLLFRCGLALQRGLNVPDGEEADQAGAAKDAAKDAAADAPPLPKAKPPPRTKPKVATGSEAEPSAPSKEAPKPKAKAKPKVDDAYRPPALPKSGEEPK